MQKNETTVVSKSQKFRTAIIYFFKTAKKEKRESFKSPELISYIRKFTGIRYFYPDTVLRELRKMRELKELNYICKDKKSMEYYFLKTSRA